MMEENMGDPATPSGSRPSERAADGVSPAAAASIPVADESEHLPLMRRPRSHWEYGINYGARRVRAFMCRVDWDCELGVACGGNRVYPSIEDLRENRKCVAGCGIVEVEVTLYRVHDWGSADDAAQGGEAEGGDAEGGSVHEHPVREADAP